MTLNQRIIEAAAQIGVDRMTATDLHRDLCHWRDERLAATYAAEHVLRAIELYAQADAIMAKLAALAQEPTP